jgi:WD40 repeat protein
VCFIMTVTRYFFLDNSQEIREGFLQWLIVNKVAGIEWNLCMILQSTIGGVDWSSKNHSLIYSIDEGGTLIVWNVESNTLRSLQFGNKVVATCLQACPEEDNVVCFGTKGGNVFIVDTIGNGFVVSVRVMGDLERI